MADCSHNGGDHHGACCSHASGAGYQQSLSELDFERGLWGAALEGDVSRLKNLLDRGHAVDSTDNYGYTALVRRSCVKPI